MNIVKATAKFEKWLAQHTHVLKQDLRLKHQLMAESAFLFLRGTFYRWVQLWPEICPEIAKAPHVLAVGDLHVENFGTWRDIEGRLIWGVNDFDEAYTFAYSIDLVRLVASALLAAEDQHLAVQPKDACDAILEGYSASLRQGGEAFVLGEKHQWLRLIAESELRDPVLFWRKMDRLRTISEIPVAAREALEHLMPEHGLAYRLAHRVAGLGSLGRERFVALANWHGGRIAREAKALVPSCVYWANQDSGPAEILCHAVLSQAVRCPDPFVQVRGRWMVRRLGPHCSRIELETLRAAGDELRLLHAMGWETANIHLGSPNAKKTIQPHLKKLKAGWLHAAAKSMVKALKNDWHAWRKANAS
jgi:Uncharacterized protein conserved in bacteria (DUF2252)